MVKNYIENGTNLAESLRKAIINLQESKNFFHPFYWSSFQLLGDSVGSN